MQQERIRAVRRAVAGCILVAGLFLMGCAPSQEVTHYIMGLIQRVDTLYLGTDWKAHHVNILYDRRQAVCKTYETAACAAQCEQYGDTHYRERVYEWGLPYRHRAWVFCADRIDSVQVRAAIAVDVGHPAGASLNDIFYFFRLPLTTISATDTKGMRTSTVG